jgi:hypothetical protein
MTMPNPKKTAMTAVTASKAVTAPAPVHTIDADRLRAGPVPPGDRLAEGPAGNRRRA